MKRRRLFKEEIIVPVSTLEEVPGPGRRTTQSMVKQGPILHVPSFAEDLVDIPTSPEKDEMYVATISEAEELVTETLKDLRREVEAREEITEKVVQEPVNSLTKHQLEMKVKNLTK
jgi:hypothetical protein